MSKRNSYLISAVVLLLGALPVFAATQLPQTVATVNGEKISRAEIEGIVTDWYAPVALDEWIQYRLVGQEAKKAGVVVPPEEVKARIEEIRTQIVSPGQDFEELLARRGLTYGHFFAVIKMQLQSDAVIKKSLTATSEDLVGYRKASHIVITVSPTQDKAEADKRDKEAKDKIDKIAQEIKDGKSFDDAAKEYSDDRLTKDKGGDLGYVTQESMGPEFGKVLFSLKPGEVSEPAKTNYAYELIKYVKPATEATAEEKAKLDDEILMRKLADKRSEWLLSIRNKAVIINNLRPEKPAPTKAAPPVPKVKPNTPAMPMMPPPGETPPPPPDDMPAPPPAPPSE